MTLLPFFDWCQNTTLASFLRNSVWVAPVVDFFHLLGLAMVFGPVLIVNLRLMGLVFTGRPAAEIATALRPWWWRGLGVSFASGVLFFIGNALKVYGNPPFYLKMALLGVAITWQTTIIRKLTESPEPGRVSARLAALFSTVLWMVIPAAGYWIELY